MADHDHGMRPLLGAPESITWMSAGTSTTRTSVSSSDGSTHPGHHEYQCSGELQVGAGHEGEWR